MNHSNFDDVFSSTLNADTAYMTDAAMQYLSELEEMKDKFGECTESLKEMKKHISLIYEAVEKYKAQISILWSHVHEKDREIASLRSQLKKGGANWSSTDLGKIEIQVKVLTNQIKIETERFHRTGNYANIEQSINNVRNLFNIVLDELNKLNAENRSVGSILQTLVTLEVNLIFLFLIKLNLINKNYSDVN